MSSMRNYGNVSWFDAESGGLRDVHVCRDKCVVFFRICKLSIINSLSMAGHKHKMNKAYYHLIILIKINQSIMDSIK